MRAILLLVILADYRSVRKILGGGVFRELHKGFADAAALITFIFV